MTDDTRARSERRPVTIHGRGAYPGVASGEALVADATLPGWNTFDLDTGAVNELTHPLAGISLKGRVLVVAGARGSTGWATQFLQLRLSGFAPAAMLFPRIDARLGAACVVTQVPVVAEFDAELFAVIHTGDLVEVDGDRGTVTISPKV